MDIPSGHAKLVDGSCIPTRSDTSLRYIYQGNMLVSTERVNKSTGQVHEKWIVTYLDNGLYDATRYQSGAPYWKAEYFIRE